MLTFYRSPKLELLANELVKVYSEKPLADPLEEEIVIVQNHGMAQWLSKWMARTMGISGNVKFPFPAEKIWDFYRTMDETIPKDLPSDREPMTWAVYSLLQNISDQSPYKSVWYYTRGENGKLNSLKTWKLAVRIGDLFDQYLIYRPTMILNWEDDKYKASGAQEAWQADLWNRLQSRWQKNYPDLRWMHRAAIHRDFMQALRKGDIDKEKMPERLTFFGLSGMPPTSIDAFVHLSRQVDIHWFWMDPAAGSSLGSLEESWGGEGQEFLSLFSKAIEKSSVNVEEVHLAGEETEKGTRPPQRAESQTLDLFTPTPGLHRTSLPNLQIHSCHSEQREMEVLHDNILELFNSNPDLEPDDILILAPDIQRYAPFIKGVFGTTEEGQPAIPFTLLMMSAVHRKRCLTFFPSFSTCWRAVLKFRKSLIFYLVA
ncbi:MAG: exodeoxyribonuclease V subunit gamma [Balneolaceae bacterium]|nr:exodeoxyribonuclease V subunit gamma [Balneolaceae bacterium]